MPDGESTGADEEFDFQLSENEGGDQGKNISDNTADKPDSKKPDTKMAPGGDLPLSMAGIPAPGVSINLAPGHFELVIADDCKDTTDIVANADFHAFFIKDKTASQCLDRFSEATAGLCPEPSANKNLQMRPHSSSRIFLPLVERLRKKSPDTKVIFTTRKTAASDQLNRYLDYVSQLCESLKLSTHDKDLIAGAFTLHALARIGSPHPGQNRYKKSADAGIALPENFEENPVMFNILRSMYRSLKPEDIQNPSLEVTGGNILTIVDLYSDTVHDKSSPGERTLKSISDELKKMAGQLIRAEVVEAFVKILNDETNKVRDAEKSARIIIFSDQPDNIYSLKIRLRNDGLHAITTESLETLPKLFGRVRPDLLVIRLHAAAPVVIKAIQYLSISGVNLDATPTFLLVKNSIIPRLAHLIKMGIEDILDLDTDFEVFLLKIKKTMMHRDSPSIASGQSSKQSGSRGNLSEMNIIDLLQALGPSRRTSKITVSQENSSSEPLMIYLDHGNITFAQLGELEGETAIHKALTWTSGTWVVEQVTEGQLPEPNNDLPNEAILMEGCRLMDESSK
jgi:hypothetical protein